MMVIYVRMWGYVSYIYVIYVCEDLYALRIYIYTYTYAVQLSCIYFGVSNVETQGCFLWAAPPPRMPVSTRNITTLPSDSHESSLVNGGTSQSVQYFALMMRDVV